MQVRPLSRSVLQVVFVLYILFIASIICSWNAVSSISIGLIAAIGLYVHKKTYGVFISRNLFTLFTIGCFFFFIFQCLALLYTENRGEGVKHIQLKTALIVLPLALGVSYSVNDLYFEKMKRWFVYILSLTSVFCVAIAFNKYLQSGDNSYFFYHKLLLPIDHHAIQFSILVFFALVLLLEEIARKKYLIHPILHFTLTAYLIMILVLLSSKLVIAFFLLYVVYWGCMTAKKVFHFKFALPIASIAFLSLTSILVFTKNPVTNRFADIIAGKIQLVSEDKFNPGIYFNGLQFRLLQWRFVVQILNDHNAWLTGLGPGDAQEVLDKKYIAANMYIGDSATGERGFLGYNTHNQFLESLLQTGIPGLACFLLICTGMIQMAIRARRKELSAVVVLLLAYSLNESVFETQYGSMIFLFLPLFLYYGLESIGDRQPQMSNHNHNKP